MTLDAKVMEIGNESKNKKKGKCKDMGLPLNALSYYFLLNDCLPTNSTHQVSLFIDSSNFICSIRCCKSLYSLNFLAALS